MVTKKKQSTLAFLTKIRTDIFSPSQISLDEFYVTDIIFQRTQNNIFKYL